MCLDSTVFLIEDDAAVRDALSISLNMAGLNVEVYPSGSAFLEVYTEDRPGCLVINLSQPDREGLTVQQELITSQFSDPGYFHDRNRVDSEFLASHAVRSFLFAGETCSQALVARTHPRSNGMERVRGDQPTEGKTMTKYAHKKTYTCPMHPEVRHGKSRKLSQMRNGPGADDPIESDVSKRVPNMCVRCILKSSAVSPAPAPNAAWLWNPGTLQRRMRKTTNSPI